MQVRRTYILILFLLSFLAYTGLSQAADTVWVEDSPPSGSIRGGTGEGWVWVSANPSPHSGSLAHQSAVLGGMHQHFFYNTPTANRLSINAGDTLFTYVYLDPTNPPSEIMLAWNSGAGQHRAYWGANSINLGVDGTASRRYMGALPPVGQWVRLEVPANQVGLEGSSLHGMAFALYNGRATWDRAGKSSSPSGSNIPPLVNLSAPTNNASYTAPATITLNANATDSDGSISQVEFYHGGTLINTDTSAPYSYTWSNVPVGSYNLTARAIDNTGAVTASTPITVTVRAVAGTDLVWVEDSPPSGSIRGGTGEGWVWVSANPSPHSGSLAHQSAVLGGMHQHFFYNTPTANRLSINAGDTLFTYVYLDPTNPPSEIMLAWNSGAGQHRAYWGANSINLGVDGTASRRYMGALPPVGQWVRLEVPANQVGLEGSSLHGMAFALYNGRATWDRAGKSSSPSGSNIPPLVNLNAPTNNASYTAPATITLNANATDSDGSISQVEFYNGGTLINTDTSAPYSYTWSNVPVGSYNLTARATDNTGASTTSTVVNVSVIASAPSVSISANPTTISSGGSSTLTWSSSNATSCTASGGWSGSKATSGNQLTGALNTTSTYTLSCTGAGGSTSQSVSINVGAALYALNVTVSGSGTVTSNPSGIACGVTCSASYPSGAVVTLSAVAAAGYTFSGWSGACTGTGTCTTTLSAARSVTATFALTALTAPTIESVAAACSAEPMRGNVFYYCDCGSGASASCVPGSDLNAGTSESAPRQTIANAATRFRTLGANNTIALCKGGAFDATAALFITNNHCGPGVACNDFRDYTPTTFTGTAKPIINNKAGAANLFNIWSGGGVRLLNLKLQGDGVSRVSGVMLYRGARDVTMCNLDMDSFAIAVYNESNDGNTNNIKLTGSNITNSRVMGYLGGGDNTEISYNNWLNNGNDTVFNHTLYLASGPEIKNVAVLGNVVRGQYSASTSTTPPVCLGAPIVGHMAVDGLLVKDNVVDIDPLATTEGCWGIAFNNLTGAPKPIYHRNAIFSGNTIKNGGNLALTVSGCPGCVIENNLIINETSKAGTGISVATRSPRAGIADDVNDRNIIRNNTIWYSLNSNNGGKGIEVGSEGTGHIIANNTVTYSATTTGRNGPFICFGYPLGLAAYALINNNHCQSAANFNWEATRGSLASWRTYSAASGFDTASFTGNPLFTAAGTNFTPSVGSPLIGAGNALYGSLFDMFGKARTNPPAIGAVEGN